MENKTEPNRAVVMQTPYALEPLYVLVRGECPSLLEDDHHDQIVRDTLIAAEQWLKSPE